MADLGTLTVTTGSPSAFSSTTGVGAAPYFEVIASANDSTYVYDATNSTHQGSCYLQFADMPSDFGSMATLFVRLRYLWDTGTQVNSWSLSAQFIKSDGVSALTNEVTVASSITETTATNSSVIEFTGVDTSATKADWDGARFYVYWNITKNKSGDTIQKRVTAAEVTGTYNLATTTLDLGTGSFALSAPNTSLGRGFLAGVGSFTLTGQPTTLTHGYSLVAGTGAFSLSGPSVILNTTLPITEGTLSLTGQPVTLVHGYHLSLNYLDYTLTGAQSSRSWVGPAEYGAFALNGQNVELIPPATGYNLDLGTGSFALTGQSVALVHGYPIAAETGTFALSGQSVSFNLDFPISFGSFALAGQPVTLSYGTTLVAEFGSYALSGQPTTRDFGLPISHLPYTLSGQDVGLTYNPGSTYTLDIEYGAFAVNGASGPRSWIGPVDTGVFALSGQDVELFYVSGFVISLGTGFYNTLGPVAYRDISVAIQPGSRLLGGQSLGLTYSGGPTYQINLNFGNFILTGPSVGLNYSQSTYVFTIGTGSYEVTGAVGSRTWIGPVDTGALALTGQAVSLSAFNLALGTGSYSLAGQAVFADRSVPINFGALSVSGQEVDLVYIPLAHYEMSIERGLFAVTGKPTLRNLSLAAIGGNIFVNGQDSIITPDLSEGSFSVTGQPVDFVRDLVLQEMVGPYILVGGSMSLIYSGAPPGFQKRRWRLRHGFGMGF